MQQLIQTGLRYGDTCKVISLVRPTRKITLNRTCWDIVPEGDASPDQMPLILVPGMKPRSFRWRLQLTPVAGESRFLLRSLDGHPFPLNGQWGRESFVEGADIVTLQDAARLEFQRASLVQADLPPALPEVLQHERLIHSELPILLQGETGTGKGYWAHQIHRRSGRLGQWVSLNIAALSPGLVESELFGHRRGSFTGAIKDKEGALALAHGGTLFLDEIDSLTLELQVKLLQFLDHGFYRPVGMGQERRTSARLLFAAGQPLKRLVSEGRLRQDLYYRLNQGALVELRPLRERPTEITRHCQLFALEEKLIIGPQLIDFYRTLPWPGNVRQLRGHLMGKKVRSKTHKLDFDQSDEALLTMSSDLTELLKTPDRLRPMEEVKREYARHAFERCQGQLRRTARELQVNSKTLKGWLAV